MRLVPKSGNESIIVGLLIGYCRSNSLLHLSGWSNHTSILWVCSVDCNADSHYSVGGTGNTLFRHFGIVISRNQLIFSISHSRSTQPWEVMVALNFDIAVENSRYTNRRELERMSENTCKKSILNKTDIIEWIDDFSNQKIEDWRLLQLDVWYSHENSVQISYLSKKSW